jgi:hypothetical protein
MRDVLASAASGKPAKTTAYQCSRQPSTVG